MEWLVTLLALWQVQQTFRRKICPVSAVSRYGTGGCMNYSRQPCGMARVVHHRILSHAFRDGVACLAIIGQSFRQRLVCEALAPHLGHRVAARRNVPA